MNKFHRFILLKTICVLALLIFTSHVYALFDSNVKKAKEFMQAGMYPQAIALLEKEITEDPTNEEAHFQLGISYINQGNYSGADERFASAVKLKPAYGYKIGKEFKKASDEALKKGNLSSSSVLFDKAIIYDPSYKKQGYDFYMTLGDKLRADHYYDRALQYSDGDKDKSERVGFKFLKLAAKEWPSSRCESLKRKASGLVGEKIVQEIFPVPFMKTIFEKTYTYSDAFDKKDGTIRTFELSRDGIKVGDQIELIAKLIGSGNFSGEEIWIWQGKDMKPKWARTINGYYTQKIEVLQPSPDPNGGYFIISLDGRKDVEVTVRVKRNTVPVPNIALLSSYLKE